MPELRSADGRYLAAEQGDGNFVLYDTSTDPWTVLADRWSYEARQAPVATPTPGRVPPRHLSAQGVRAIRVTNETDGDFVNRQYSYWSSVFCRGDEAIVFAGHVDEHPRFFHVSLTSGAVERLGSLLPYTGTAEGWYFDPEGRLYLCNGAELRRIDSTTQDDRLVFSIAETHPGCILWQAHSSDGGTVHCATVKQVTSEGAYPALGTVVFRNGREEYFPAQGDLDESQLTTDGAFLIIHEANQNRIINLETRETRYLSNADGAVEHADCGPDYIVGEDDQHGACVRWNLRAPLTAERRLELFKTWNMGHLSVRNGCGLLSDETHLSLVDLNSGGIEPLIAHGMTGSGYDCQVKANLDHTACVASYMSNTAGRMDLYLLVLG